MGGLAVEVEQIRRVFDLRKRFRRPASSVTALDGVDLTIDPGEIFGLLGPNGAGKTTLVKILATVLIPTSGVARIGGYDVVADTAKVRSVIGIVLGGERGLYTRLTARQNLRYWAALYHLDGAEGRRRSDELLERVGLVDRADQPVETFSRGMKQRLHLARGLIGDPQVVLLDEPTTGMDPVASKAFRDLVRELREEGRTILLTTHDMAEAEALCDRVGLIDRGRMLAIEPPRVLGRWLDEYERIDVEGVPAATLAEVAALAGVAAVEAQPDGSTRIQVQGGDTARLVLESLVAAGVTSLRTSTPSLEEVYVAVFGERGMHI